MAFEIIGITMIIHNKEDIQFVIEFPCFLGHPVSLNEMKNKNLLITPCLRWRLKGVFANMKGDIG